MTDIEYINRFSPYTLKLKEDDVFIFQIHLLDNDIDSDNEFFSVQAIHDMSRMFLGKTGFCGSSTARIFRTWVEPENKKTKDGRNYTALYAKAYMVITKENEDVRKEISAGIMKEVSLSCSVNKMICSLCGTNISKEQCNHKKGRECYYILDEVTDVYEWSFVMPTTENLRKRGWKMTTLEMQILSDPERVKSLETIIKIRQDKANRDRAYLRDFEATTRHLQYILKQAKGKLMDGESFSLENRR